MDVDHLVYAVPDLAAGMDVLAGRLGVRPAPGGRHPGRGTANALLALGPDAYLELIGPDPDRPPPATPRWFGLDALAHSRLAGWAVRPPDLDACVRAAHRAGYDPGPVTPGRRTRPDGTVLAWRLAFPADNRLPCDGLVPFLIDWTGAAHPATTAPPGCTLLDLRAEHPHPETLRTLLDALGASLPCTPGPHPRLVATLDTPRGRVVLA